MKWADKQLTVNFGFNYPMTLCKNETFLQFFFSTCKPLHKLLIKFTGEIFKFLKKVI